MAILKKLLYALGLLLVLILIIAAFTKKDFSVERSVLINKPQQEVYDYVKLLKNQDFFSKWNKLDPNMKKTYQGTDGTVGFTYRWESNDENVGIGEQEIMKLVPNERIDLEIRFEKPFKAVHPAYFLTQANGPQQTKVTWGFSGDMKYPLNIMLLFMDFEKMIGDDLQTGLNNLKTNLDQH